MRVVLIIFDYFIVTRRALVGIFHHGIIRKTNHRTFPVVFGHKTDDLSCRYIMRIGSDQVLNPVRSQLVHDRSLEIILRVVDHRLECK